MKKLIIPLILVFISSCNKNTFTPELNYNSKVIRTAYVNENLQDSSIFYYSDQFKLLQIDRYLTPFAPNEIKIIYELNKVSNDGNTYLLDSKNRVISYINLDYRIDYTYDNELIVYEKHATKNVVHEEHYYEYSNSNLVKDSTLNHNPQIGATYITVIRNTYTDTLKPKQMIHYSGLYEFPSFSKYLIRESNSDTYVDLKLNKNAFLNKYSYVLSDSTIIERIQLIDENYMTNMEVDSIIYTVEKK